MRPDSRRFAVGAIAVALLAGCAALAPRLEAPEVSLVGVSVRELSLNPRVDLRLELRNPNRVEVPIDRIDFVLRIEDARFGSGQSKAPVTLPALGTVIAEVAVQVDLRDALRHLRGRLREGGGAALRYEIAGDATIGGITRPFRRTGEVDPARLLGTRP